MMSVLPHFGKITNIIFVGRIRKINTSVWKWWSNWEFSDRDERKWFRIAAVEAMLLFWRLSIEQLLAQHITAFCLGACGWLHRTLTKGCHNNTHWPVSLPHLSLRTQLNTLLAAGLFLYKLQTNGENIWHLTAFCLCKSCGHTPP